MPYSSVRTSDSGDGRGGILGEAQAGNHVGVQLGQMGGAVRIAEWNSGQCRNLIHPPQPIFDHGLEFSLQYVHSAKKG